MRILKLFALLVLGGIQYSASQSPPTAPAPEVVTLDVGADGNAAGIVVADPSRPGPVIVWLHGGMRSARRDKGPHAVVTLRPFLPRGAGLLCSPSAYAGSDWLQPSGLAHIEALLDSVEARYPRARMDSLVIAGVSDGCLGALHYAARGKRKPLRFILFSAHPGIALAPGQLRDDPAFNATRWDIFQGGKDRLFPSAEVFPLLREWARANPRVKLHLYPRGEHDFGWYAENVPEEIKKAVGNR
jgi:pimeloyl-ACP methyl ester carboxylesterase